MTEVTVKYDDPGVQGFAIRCEDSEEEMDADIADFAEQFKTGAREALDDDGEVIDHTTITDERALELAREEIDGDWGRDGWAVGWVQVTDGEQPYEIHGDREQMTLFPSVEAAKAFIAAHMQGTNDTLEIWGIL